MKTFHITYYLKRESENGPLLSGKTVQAENIILAIGKFLNESGIEESEIKYIIEL